MADGVGQGEVKIDIPSAPSSRIQGTLARQPSSMADSPVMVGTVHSRVRPGASAQQVKKLKMAILLLAIVPAVVLGVSVAALAISVQKQSELQGLQAQHAARVNESGVRFSILESGLAHQEALRTSGDMQVESKLDAEKASRKGADAALSSALSAEQLAREERDAAIQAEISQAKSERQADELSAKIIVAGMVSDRQSALTALRAGVAAETTARQTADATFASDLSTATSDRATADTTLTTKIASEATSRQAADTAITQAISGDTTERTSGDTAISSAIDSAETSRSTSTASLNTSIQAETPTRVSADAQLSSDIATASTARSSADAALTTSVAALATGRSAVDTQLNSSVLAASPVRQSTDASLSQSLAAETATRSSNTTALSSALSSEASTRAAEDANIRASIDDAKTHREGNDTVLTASLSSSISVRSSDITALSSTLSAESSTRKVDDAALNSSLSSIDPNASAQALALAVAVNATIQSEVSARKSADAAIDAEIINSNNQLCQSHGTGCTWINLEGGTNGPVYYIELESDYWSTSLLLGGEFTTANGGTITNRPNMVGFYQDGSVSNWAASTGWDFWTSGKVNKHMTVYQCGGRFAFGDFLSATDNSENTERTYAKRIAYWKSNGSELESVGTGADAEVHDAVMAPGECEMYIVGKFTTVHGQPRNRIVHQSAREVSNVFQREWNAVGDGCDGDIYTIVIDSVSSVLYMGGAFLSCGNVSTPYIASYNIGNSTYASVGAPLDGPVYSLFFDSNGGLLYAGGNFTGTTSGGNSMKNAAVIKVATEEWSSVGNPNAPIRKIMVGGSVIYIAGDFTEVNGQAISGIAAYNGYWLSVEGAPASGIETILYAESLLAIGGNFTVPESGVNNVAILYRSL